MKKKILSLALAFMLILGMTPTGVFAAGGTVPANGSATVSDAIAEGETWIVEDNGTLHMGNILGENHKGKIILNNGMIIIPGTTKNLTGNVKAEIDFAKETISLKGDYTADEYSVALSKNSWYENTSGKKDKGITFKVEEGVKANITGLLKVGSVDGNNRVVVDGTLSAGDIQFGQKAKIDVNSTGTFNMPMVGDGDFGTLTLKPGATFNYVNTPVVGSAGPVVLTEGDAVFNFNDNSLTMGKANVIGDFKTLLVRADVSPFAPLKITATEATIKAGAVLNLVKGTSYTGDIVVENGGILEIHSLAQINGNITVKDGGKVYIFEGNQPSDLSNAIFNLETGGKIFTESREDITVKPGYGPNATQETYNSTSNTSATFKKVWERPADVIPAVNGTTKPTNYVTVTFAPGVNGSLAGTTTFYVNPDVEVELTSPAVTANSGYTFTGWDKVLKGKFTTDTTITALYELNTVSWWNHRYAPTLTPTSTPAESAQKAVVRIPYIEGYPDKSVKPENSITRAEAAAMISRLAILDVTNKAKANFGDAEDSWYNPYLNAATKANLLLADKDGNIRPDQAITRAEFARMISPLDKTNTAVAPFADVKGHVFEKEINQAYGNKRIQGYPDGSFKPDNAITRAEAAQILNSMYNRKTTVTEYESIKDRLPKFTDLTKAHWAFYEIMEATRSY